MVEYQINQLIGESKMPSNRPSQYNRSAINRNTIATVARQDEALRLRRQGMAYIDIARQLGYTPNGVPRPQSAAEAVRAAERREQLSGAALANNAVAAVAATTAVAPVAAAAVANAAALTRTFGVEIEFFGITPRVAVDALTAAGISAASESYNHQTRAHWKIVTDASVTSRGTGCGSGLELVSPILRGANGFAETAKAVTALLNAGAKVDKSCGIHVHVGADGMTGADIIRVVDLYVQNNTHLDTVLAASRLNNGYAMKYNNAAMQNLRNALRRANGVNDIQSGARGLPRYMVVNITSYLRHGTIEFRQHQGSLNGEKVVSWVKTIIAIMEKGASMQDGDVQDFGSLDAFTTALGLDDQTKTYLNNRATTLAGSR